MTGSCPTGEAVANETDQPSLDRVALRSMSMRSHTCSSDSTRPRILLSRRARVLIAAGIASESPQLL